jgi:hypothetical protein
MKLQQRVYDSFMNTLLFTMKLILCIKGLSSSIFINIKVISIYFIQISIYKVK